MAEDLRRELGPPMVGAVISCRPEDPEFPAFLDRQLRRPHIRGLRRVLHVAPDDISRGYFVPEEPAAPRRDRAAVRRVRLRAAVGTRRRIGRRLPKYAIRARSLRSAGDRVGHLGAVACGDRRSCAAAESRRQDFRPPRLCGLARLERGAHLPTLEGAAICLTLRRHWQERVMTASVFDLDPKCSIGRESCRH
jgi:hypothetical protein